MAINMDALVNDIENTLMHQGYNTIRCNETIKHPTIDIIAVKMAQSIITKIVQNIDSIAEDLLYDMTVIAHFINAIPLLIGLKNRRAQLEDNTIYFRYKHKIMALNPTTFKNLIIRQIYPYIIAKRGTFMGIIDGNKLRKRREELYISRRELAEKLKVSIKTIAEYERGTMRPSLKNINIMEKVLESKLITPIDILHIKRDYELDDKLPNKKPPNSKRNSDFYNELYDIFMEIGLRQFWTNKTPFDVLISIPNEQAEFFNGRLSNNRTRIPKSEHIPLISSVILDESSREVIKINTIRGFLKCFRISGAVIVEDEKIEKECKKANVPAINKKELNEVKNPKEFQKLIKKKI
ncbi:MAG: helix-turn-helix domain-containing protein [Promethearchaeota archaeon]